MKFSKDWSQACRVVGVVSLENSHALVDMLFFSTKFVLDFLKTKYFVYLILYFIV